MASDEGRMSAEFLFNLVQFGPTGAGLAFALLGYWLLTKEQALVDGDGIKLEPRVDMLSAIRFFMSLATFIFCLGITANLLTAFGDKLILSLWRSAVLGPR
jgi:hypothetical protein